MSRILRVSMERGEVSFEPVPERWARFGGRAMVARFLLDEVPADCDPLGPENKLIITPGTLVGHMVSACDRISVGAKSPLTGGVKEANAGGTTGLKMVWLGLHSIVIEGGPPSDGKWRLLYVNPEGARLESAEDLAGLELQQLADVMMDRYHKNIGLSAIGPGGERLYKSAGITHMDKDRHQTRISARGGLGAVMGSKMLKAIVFDQPRSNQPELFDRGLFRAASKRYIEALQNHPQTSQVYTFYGTAAMVQMCNAFGGIPTRNFSQGQFEHADKISGETIHDLNKSRGGTVDHACMPGCIIKCSNIYHGPDHEMLVTPLEYETVGLMGSNLGIDNPDDIARMSRRLDELGLDTIEVGAAMGVAAEAGLMAWGDAERALELIDEITQDSEVGRMLGNGAAHTGKILNVERVPVVKNQAISAYDPRAIKGTGVTYATSPQGADHTCGLTIRAQVTHTEPQGQVELSRNSQFAMAGYDSLGVCIMGGFGFGMDPSIIPDMINGRYGWGVASTYLRDLGRECILMEREFNRRAGFTRDDDRLPKWMTTEILQPMNTVFDVPDSELDAIFDAS